MAQGFYEMLGVEPDAGEDELRVAFQKRLAALVRRLKAARRHGADVSLLEFQERSLREAREILSDPVRRRRYDAFRKAADDMLPGDADGLWEQACGVLVDPISLTALNVVRELTDLPVGHPVPGLNEVLPQAPSPLVTPRSIQDIPLPGVRDVPASGHDLPQPSRTSPPRAVVSSPRPQPAQQRMPRHSAPPVRAEYLNRQHSPTPSLSDLTDGEAVEMFSSQFGFDGRFIRAIRELRGMTLEQLSQATRINQRYLSAIEGNGFDKLPAATFVRGYVKEIARELDLADRDLVDGYMRLFRRHRG